MFNYYIFAIYVTIFIVCFAIDKTKIYLLNYITLYVIPKILFNFLK